MNLLMYVLLSKDEVRLPYFMQPWNCLGSGSSNWVYIGLSFHIWELLAMTKTMETIGKIVPKILARIIWSCHCCRLLVDNIGIASKKIFHFSLNQTILNKIFFLEAMPLTMLPNKSLQHCQEQMIRYCLLCVIFFVKSLAILDPINFFTDGKPYQYYQMLYWLDQCRCCHQWQILKKLVNFFAKST